MLSPQDIDLPVLEALADEPSLSQRELAQKVGLSLTRAHFVLKRLVEKGLVKVKSAAFSEHKLGYLYLLTPQGLDAKARLTYAFLQRTAEQYQRMSDRVERVLDDAAHRATRHEEGPVATYVVGVGPLAEVVRDMITLRVDMRKVEAQDAATLVVEVGLDDDAGPLRDDQVRVKLS
jgi:EPS-associated MarR family transcriptional regulator